MFENMYLTCFEHKKQVFTRIKSCFKKRFLLLNKRLIKDSLSTKKVFFSNMLLAKMSGCWSIRIHYNFSMQITSEHWQKRDQLRNLLNIFILKHVNFFCDSTKISSYLVTKTKSQWLIFGLIELHIMKIVYRTSQFS